MKSLLKVVISALLIIFAIHFLNMQAISETIKSGSVVSFVGAMILNLLGVLVMGIRWHQLIKSSAKLVLILNLVIYLKATFLNTFTPANLGGDIYRLAVLKGEMKSHGVLFKLLLRERLIGLYGYLIVFSFAYIFMITFEDVNMYSAENPYTYGAISALGMFLLLFALQHLSPGLVALMRSISGKERMPHLESWSELMANLLTLKGVLPLMLLTLCGVLLWVVAIKVVGEGFGVSIPLMHLAAVATLVEVIRLVPITIQGIGLREGVFAYLLAFLGHNVEQCYVVATVAYLTLSAAIILCGPIGYAIGWRIRCNFSPVLNEERSE